MFQQYRFRNKANVSPTDVKEGDAFAVKLTAVAGRNNTWFATQAPSDWSDQRAADQGDPLLEEQAAPLFYVMRNSGREYFVY